MARVRVEVYGNDVQYVEEQELRIFEIGSQSATVVQSPYLVTPERPLEKVEFYLKKLKDKDELVMI